MGSVLQLTVQSLFMHHAGGITHYEQAKKPRVGGLKQSVLKNPRRNNTPSRA